jgi:hypothetical protein
MIQRLFSWGVSRLFGGLRQGRPGLAGLSAAVTFVSWLRRRRAPEKQRIYAVNLKEGQAVKVRFLRGEAVVDETEVVG